MTLVAFVRAFSFSFFPFFLFSACSFDRWLVASAGLF
jgi:hypothetical protein